MKNLFAVALMGLAISLILSSTARAQYTTGYAYSYYDASSYLSTKNLWFNMGGYCQSGTLSTPHDGYIMCLAGDGHPQTYNTSTRSWTKLTAMGTMQTVAAGSSQLIYGISSRVCDQYGNLSLYKWSGSAWGLISNACAKTISVGEDGTLAITNTAGGFYSTNGGTTWIAVPYAMYLSAFSSSSICGVFNYAVELMQADGTFAAPSGAPSGVTSCALTNDGLLYVNGSFGTQVYNIVSGVWTSIDGSIASLAAFNKGTTFALNSSNALLHLNVYLLEITGTTSGSLSTGCGPGGCPPGILHTGKLQVNFPHSLGVGQFGQQQTAQDAPTANMNLVASDVALDDCDPLFGNPEDPSCIPTSTGTVQCPLAGTLAGAGPPPPVGGTAHSRSNPGRPS